jgi:oligopeptide transport system substrate-binding protein
MWKKTLGVDVALENQEWKVFLDNRQNLNYAVARAGSVGSFVDPADFLSSYTSDNGMNDTGWSNAEYDALIQQAARTTDTAERFRLLQQAEAIIVNQAPVLPIYYYTYVNLISPEVEGWHYNAIQRPFFKGVHLSQEETQ